MSKRFQLVSATILLIVGAVGLMGSYLGGGELTAASVAETGFDLTKIFIWGGAAALILSALLFIGASAE